MLVAENLTVMSELVTELPDHVEDTMWEAWFEKNHPNFEVPPEHLFVNDEFVLTTSHGLHEISKPKVSKFCKLSGFNFRQVFRKHLKRASVSSGPR